MMNALALIIGYAVLIFGGVALTGIFIWWSIEVVCRRAGWTGKLLQVMWRMTEEKRGEFPAR